jgi:Spy/CpxP family protein refolding chaperone
MSWFSLRCGWGNTAAIFALLLLPAAVIADFRAEPTRSASQQAADNGAAGFRQRWDEYVLQTLPMEE